MLIFLRGSLEDLSHDARQLDRIRFRPHRIGKSHMRSGRLPTIIDQPGGFFSTEIHLPTRRRGNNWNSGCHGFGHWQTEPFSPARGDKGMTFPI